jgi:hypothetical protein
MDDFNINRWMRGAGMPAGQFMKGREENVRVLRHRQKLPEGEPLPAKIR